MEISEKLLKKWSCSNYHVLKIFNSQKLSYFEDETQKRIVYKDIHITCAHYGKPNSKQIAKTLLYCEMPKYFRFEKNAWIDGNKAFNDPNFFVC